MLTQHIRSKAIKSYLDKPMNPFKTVKDKSPDEAKGCNCKKSSCSKKYCECYLNNQTCGKLCKCIDW